jgi:hypothetical protein
MPLPALEVLSAGSPSTAVEALAKWRGNQHKPKGRDRVQSHVVRRMIGINVEFEIS